MSKVINIKFLQVLLIFSVFIGLKAYGEDVIKEEGTYLNLSVTETKQVEPDILIASLRYESESESAKEVQNKINQMMKKALSVVEKKENVEVSTEQYSVYKFYKPLKQGEPQKELWKGSQSIFIKSKSTEDILALSGQLQEIGLVMSDLHYEVSLAKIEETRTSMVENAINKLLSHAKRVASIIGLKEVKIKNINIDGDNRYPPVPYPKLMRTASVNMTSSVTAPISAPGKIDITLNISATILLKNWLEEFMSLKEQSEASIKDSLSEKYESEMAGILEELKKDANVGKAIDRIIEEAADLGEMQSKLILLIKKYLAKLEFKTDKLTGKKSNLLMRK